MAHSLVNLSRVDAIASIALNDPDRRNALGVAMFDAFDEAIATIRDDQTVNVVVLRGEGAAFCAGFDLAAAVDDPAVMGTYIERLNGVLQALRRVPQAIVASVQGAAIAGGCALLSACDFVVVERNATLGYPVHPLGVSPAVTLPTLMQIIGDDAARSLVMTGRLINGAEALRIGLASHLVDDETQLIREAQTLAERLAAHGRHAMRVTKAWINELDGSLEDNRFTAPARGSASIVNGEEAVDRLRTFWTTRK